MDCLNYSKLIRKAPHVFIIGNGGSYANAIHIANDLLSCGVSAHTIDAATLTAAANDYGYEQAFSRWIRIVGKHDDLLIALSGSGKSRNILRAIRDAKVHFMTVLAITGAYESNPAIERQAHYCIRRGKDMQAAEDYQLVWGHQIMRELRYERPARPKRTS